MASKNSVLQVLTSPRAWLLVALGFASGLPLLLVGGTLSAWMTNEGVNLKTIGVFTLVAFPYSLKFIWAPLLDRYALPFLGRRRGWMLVTQVALMGAIASMGFVNPRETPWAMASLALLVSFLSSSQDVVSDAWRTDTLSEAERGFGVATFVMGYRFGMIAAGALALSLSQFIGWSRTYWIMSSLMLVGVVATLLAPEPQGQRPPRTLFDATVVPYVDYFRRDGAMLALLFLVLFKLGDAIAGGMTTPFFLKLGFSNLEVGAITKGVGMVATIGGALVGGALLAKLGLRRSLFIFGALQALTNLTFLALALVGKSHAVLALAICSDNVCGGMATTAFGAFTMSLCNKNFSATQFALLSALANFGSRVLGASSGFLAEWMGWSGFFGLTVVLAIPGLVVLAFLPEGAATPVQAPPLEEPPPSAPPGPISATSR
ncbi:AmpG family muropeptide MFS transporter [Archangium primigenium]|uniref:AmpG family muropeptide MFS transporter n=1 Tax=[Archangium] primigenium TaxID=2792470 RepID=UPI001EF84992|nr:MFS transporter [Archangium primigenium]